MRLVVWGAGELGARVAAAWGAEGAVGLTKSAARHAELMRSGVEPALGDAIAVLRPDDALLLSLPGSAAQQEAVLALAAAGVAAPARVVLASSTGYYGALWTGRIDEDTPPGADEHAREIAAAEMTFRAWAPGGIVIRFGGLYRKGRGPLAALARTRKVPAGPPDKALALIHYEDAAATALAALRRPEAADTYLAVTPPLPTRRDFYLAASVILELSPPMFGPALGLAPAAPDVTRLRRDLLPAPKWPKWQAALIPP